MWSAIASLLQIRRILGVIALCLFTMQYNVKYSTTGNNETVSFFNRI